METRTKLEIGSFITMALLISGAYFIAPGDIAYYCESRDLVMLCEKLSSGLGTRCYFEDTYKVCKEGWIKLELGYQLELDHNSKQIICDQQECRPI